MTSAGLVPLVAEIVRLRSLCALAAVARENVTFRHVPVLAFESLACLDTVALALAGNAILSELWRELAVAGVSAVVAPGVGGTAKAG